MYGQNSAVLGTAAVTTAAWYLNGWTIAFVVLALIVAARTVYVILRKRQRP